jgi:DNA-binding CsgD family transcriptional regulator
LELLTNALELLQPDGNRYEQALILSELGQTHQRQGGAGKARLLIRQARHLAEECGAQELSQSLTPKTVPAASAGSGQAGSENAPLLGLSEAERRVMAMASQGYTNREISAKLFITVSTVEQHLTRVYRKLQVTRRTHIPPDLCLDRGETA